MNKHSIFLTALVFSLLLSCKTPNLVLSEDLQSNASVMNVKGRQGWQFNQVIRYGSYSTSKIRRGWTSGYDIGFVLRFQKAQEKLSFTQITPDGKHAEVLAVGKFRNTEYELLRGFLSYSLRHENSFAGTIIPADDRSNVWDFIVYNPEGTLSPDIDCGLARDAAGHNIYIRGIRKMDQQPAWMQFANYGFEFIDNGRSIAAVSTINNGKVWINNDLDPTRKLIISGIATSLLVRHSMQDAVANLH